VLDCSTCSFQHGRPSFGSSCTEFVYPEFWHFDNLRLMMFSLNMVDYSMSFLLLYTWDFFCWTSRGDHSEPFLLFEVYCGTPPSCLKVVGGWGGGGGDPWDFSVSPRPLSFGFLGLGLWGLGRGLDNILIILFIKKWDEINIWNSNFIFVFKFIQHLLQLI